MTTEKIPHTDDCRELNLADLLCWRNADGIPECVAEDAGDEPDPADREPSAEQERAWDEREDEIGRVLTADPEPHTPACTDWVGIGAAGRARFADPHAIARGDVDAAAFGSDVLSLQLPIRDA